MDSALLGDLCDVVRELLEIEYADIVPVRRTIECQSGAAGTCAKYSNFHDCLSGLVAEAGYADLNLSEYAASECG
jgi:hypothetical protein